MSRRRSERLRSHNLAPSPSPGSGYNYNTAGYYAPPSLDAPAYPAWSRATTGTRPMSHVSDPFADGASTRSTEFIVDETIPPAPQHASVPMAGAYSHDDRYGYPHHPGQSRGRIWMWIFAILLPPLPVFLKKGCHLQLLINVILTLLGWIPGVIHAFWILAKYEVPNY